MKGVFAHMPLMLPCCAVLLVAGVCVPGRPAAAVDQWAQVCAGDGGQHTGRRDVQAQCVRGAATAGEQQQQPQLQGAASQQGTAGAPATQCTPLIPAPLVCTAAVLSLWGSQHGWCRVMRVSSGLTS